MSPKPPKRALTDLAPFTDLPAEVADALAANAEPRRLKAGDCLFCIGDPFQQQVYIILHGTVELHRTNGELYLAGPGELLGIAGFLDAAPYTATALARGTVELLAIPAARLHQLETTYPNLYNALNRVIAGQIRSRGSDRHGGRSGMGQPVYLVMSSPPVGCDPDLPLREAVALMQTRRIGSLLLLDKDGQAMGLLSYQQVADALINARATPDGPAREAAAPAVAISQETSLWEAEETLAQERVKYLLVMNGAVPAGIVSQSDILQYLVDAQTLGPAKARKAGSLNKLAKLKDKVAQIARRSREGNRHINVAVRELSDTHLAIQRRCVELTLEQLQGQGLGAPPGDFALIIMGSGGRREMLLNPDQDNALILADEARDKKAAKWFREFTDQVNTNLDKIGYELCPGGIMARNPEYHKSLDQWRRQVSYITRQPTPKAARWANIQFDFDTLYGNRALTERLRAHILAEVQARQRLLTLMVEDDAEGRPALGWFNRLVATGDEHHKGAIDLKRNGLRIIADAVRIYALRNGIATTNTHERLQALLRLGVLPPGLLDSITAAYDDMLDLLLTHQLAQVDAHRPVDKFIDPSRISAQRQEALRMAMRAVKRFQEQLQSDFGTVVF